MKVLLKLAVGAGCGYGVLIETGKPTRDIALDDEVEVVGQCYDGVDGFNLQKGSKYPLSELIQKFFDESANYPSEFKIDWIRKKDEKIYLAKFRD